MSGWHEWLGDVPTWITTIAVIIAAVQYFGERKRRAAEGQREARAQATHLTAWTVTDVAGSRSYGVRVSNTSGSTFHDFRLDATIHGESPRSIELAIVPPGDYYVAYNGLDAEFTRDFAREVGEYGGWLRPYMKSDKYRVNRIQFTDNLGQQWTTDDRAVLAEIVTH